MRLPPLLARPLGGTLCLLVLLSAAPRGPSVGAAAAGVESRERRS